MGHHHDDLPAKMLLVEAKCLLAVPGVVEISAQFHG
jgi:hypothetical protein